MLCCIWPRLSLVCVFLHAAPPSVFTAGIYFSHNMRKAHQLPSNIETITAPFHYPLMWAWIGWYTWSEAPREGLCCTWIRAASGMALTEIIPCVFCSLLQLQIDSYLCSRALQWGHRLQSSRYALNQETELGLPSLHLSFVPYNADAWALRRDSMREISILLGAGAKYAGSWRQIHMWFRSPVLFWVDMCKRQTDSTQHSLNGFQNSMMAVQPGFWYHHLTGLQQLKRIWFFQMQGRHQGPGTLSKTVSFSDDQKVA